MSPAEYRAKVFAWAAEQGFKQIRLMIHQPKCTGTTEWVCTLGDLQAFAATLERNAAKTVEAEAAYGTIPIAVWSEKFLNPTPNDAECAFCRAMPTCPSVQGTLQRAADTDFDVVADDEMAPDPAKLPPVKLSVAMKAVPLMEAWCKSVRAETERLLLDGQPVAGFGLELGRQGNRAWRDEEEVERMLRKQFRLTLEDAYSFKLRSPTQIEKLLKDTKNPETGEKMPAVLGPIQWGKLDEHITRSEPKPSVRPASVIKTPYVPKKLEASGFEAVPDPADDLAG